MRFSNCDLSSDSSDSETDSILQDYLDNMSLEDLESTIPFFHPDDQSSLLQDLYISPQDLEMEEEDPSTLTYRTVNLKQINLDIRDFVTSPSKPATLALVPMDKATRKRVSIIASMYHLEAESKGTSRNRYLLLTRTSKTKKPTDYKELDKLLALPLFPGEKGKPAFLDSGKKASKKDSTKPSAKPKAGSVVAKDALPIDADNVGNRLLRKMGWLPGAGLGKQEKGQIEPLKVVYKPDKRGIGL